MRQALNSFLRQIFLKRIGVWALAGFLGSMSPDAIGAPSNLVSPDEALKRLIDGNRRYVKGMLKQVDLRAERLALIRGQSPFAAVLGCADSRVVPEFVLDEKLGDLFVVRLAGNFANPDVIASLEYSVKYLGTPLILVLGHENCGAVEATLKSVRDHEPFPGHIPYLVKHIRPAVETALKTKTPGDDILYKSIVANVRRNVDILQKSSPILSELVKKKQLKIVGGIYHFKTGVVEWIL